MIIRTNLQMTAGTTLTIPVLTTTQRNAISSPQEGMTIFNSDEDALNYYVGGSWRTSASTAFVETQTSSSKLFNYYNFV